MSESENLDHIPVHQRRAIAAGIVAMCNLINLMKQAADVDKEQLALKAPDYMAEAIGKELVNWTKEQLIETLAPRIARNVSDQVGQQMIIARMHGVDLTEVMEAVLSKVEEHCLK